MNSYGLLSVFLSDENKLPQVSSDRDKQEKLTCKITNIIHKYKLPHFLKKERNKNKFEKFTSFSDHLLMNSRMRDIISESEASFEEFLESISKNLYHLGIYGIQLDIGDNYDLFINERDLYPLRSALDRNLLVEFQINETRKTIESFRVLENRISDSDHFVNILKNNDKVFFKIGDIWNIKFYDEFTQVKGHTYVKYVHYILKNPNREIELAEIFSEVDPENQSYLMLKSIIDGHTIDFGTRKTDINKNIDNCFKEIDRLQKLYEKAEQAEDENQMMLWDTEISEIEKNIENYRYELRYRPKNISIERNRVANIISKHIYDFKILIAHLNLEELYLHLDNAIKVKNGVKYTLDDDNSKWYSG